MNTQKVYLVAVCLLVGTLSSCSNEGATQQGKQLTILDTYFKAFNMMLKA